MNQMIATPETKAFAETKASSETKAFAETKAVHDGDTAAAFEQFSRSFEAFKATNDERLKAIETRRGPDVLTEEKLARIDNALDSAQRRLDGLSTKAQRPHFGVSEGDQRGASFVEHKAAFDLYMRAGETTGLKTLEAKALSAGSGPDGGFLVPIPAEREILKRMSTASPIRAIASVREVSTATFKKAYSTTGPGAGWVGEAAARPQTSSQIIADLTFPTMELYAMPAATQTLLDDAAVDVEQWVAEEVQVVFAEQESQAFVNGDGVTRPQGFMTPAKVAQSAWSWGKLGYVTTGAAGAFNAANGSDALVDLIYSTKAGYRQNGKFAMNRKTQSAVRKLKATTGEYLWQPPASFDQTATLMNFPLIEMEEMPDIAADSFAVAFGDFARGYLVVDRVGIRVLRDPYSTKPYVLFYTTKRVGGGVQDYDALKLLKFGTA